MAQDDEDDPFNEEFDLVDEVDEERASEQDKPQTAPEASRGKQSGSAKGSTEEEPGKSTSSENEEDLDEYGRPKPTANYVVHVYEHQKFKRTIAREFTPEDAEAFATEYNRTANAYGRTAVSGKIGTEPQKAIS